MPSCEIVSNEHQDVVENGSTHWQTDQLVERVGCLLEVGGEDGTTGLAWATNIRGSVCLESCVLIDEGGGLALGEALSSDSRGGGDERERRCGKSELHFDCGEGSTN